MTRQMSFSKLEQGLRARLREKVNAAESTEDVKKFFAQTVGELLEKVLGDDVCLEYEDIRFNPREKDGYVISERLLGACRRTPPNLAKYFCLFFENTKS